MINGYRQQIRNHYTGQMSIRKDFDMCAANKNYLFIFNFFIHAALSRHFQIRLELAILAVHFVSLVHVYLNNVMATCIWIPLLFTLFYITLTLCNHCQCMNKFPFHRKAWLSFLASWTDLIIKIRDFEWFIEYIQWHMLVFNIFSYITNFLYNVGFISTTRD